MNVDWAPSEEKPNPKLRKNKRIKVSATPSIINVAPKEEKALKRNSPFNLLGQNLNKTTEIYQEYMFLP